jgi:hypothetical protein
MWRSSRPNQADTGLAPFRYAGPSTPCTADRCDDVIATVVPRWERVLGTIDEVVDHHLSSGSQSASLWQGLEGAMAMAKFGVGVMHKTINSRFGPEPLIHADY